MPLQSPAWRCHALAMQLIWGYARVLHPIPVIAMKSASRPPQDVNLVHESEIVWLRPPADFPWVREVWTDFPQRNGISQNRLNQLQSNGEILVGYANLHENAVPALVEGGHKHYFRRIFQTRTTDYSAYANGKTFPIEAVISESIAPKVPGLSPRRKPQIAIRLPQLLFLRLHQHLHQQDQKLTEVVVNALSVYLGESQKPSLQEQINALAARVAALEGLN